MEDYRAGLQVENLLIELYRIEIVQDDAIWEDVKAFNRTL